VRNLALLVVSGLRELAGWWTGSRSYSGDRTKARLSSLFLSLETLVSDLTPFKATDPRDVIYAVLSLAKDLTPKNKPIIVEKYTKNSPPALALLPTNTSIAPADRGRCGSSPACEVHGNLKANFIVDYNKSTLEVYKDFLEFVFRSSKSLDIICRPWAPESVKELPSWIRDLSGRTHELQMAQDGNWNSIRLNADLLVGPMPTSKSYYLECGQTEPKWRWSDDPDDKGLAVAGFNLSKVTEITCPAKAGCISVEWLRHDAVKWTDPTKLPPARFWRTLVADLDPRGGSAHIFWTRFLQEAFQKSRTDGFESISLEDTLDWDTGMLLKENYHRRVQAVIWNRMLILAGKFSDNTTQTVEDYMGLAPEHTKTGDPICILFGWYVAYYLPPLAWTDTLCSSVPVILRKTASSFGPQYQFVGELYVDGMMDGEAVDFQRTNNIPEEEFILL